MNIQKENCQNKELCVEADIFERRLLWLRGQEYHWAEQAAKDQKSAFVMFRFFLWTYLQRQKMQYKHFQSRILSPFVRLMALRPRRQIAYDPPVSGETVNPNVEVRGRPLLGDPTSPPGWTTHGANKK